MAGSRQWTVADAIRSLQAVDTDNSCDEDERDSITQSIMQSVIQAATSDSSAGHGMEWNGRRFFHIPYWQFSSIPY